ncbi:MAG: hypothetical protein CTY21_12115, partial [Methylomonas sp.]
VNLNASHRKPTIRVPGSQMSNIRTAFRDRKFQRFAIVGAAGFCVDAGILTLLMSVGWDVLLARLVSFSLAVSTTWLLNRNWTFQVTTPVTGGRQYALYTAIQILGALINLGIFTILISIYTPFRAWPWIPLGAAAFFALLFNYVATRSLVFQDN